jgi:crotonobetaine/carnitine-CoA ligase
MQAHSNPGEYLINTVKQLIEEKAKANGERVFLVENETGESLSYAEAATRADSVAATFQAHGIQNGDVVGTLLSNTIDHVLVWFGCMKAGAVFAAINTEFQQTELQTCIDTIEPDVMVVEDGCRDKYTTVRDAIEFKGVEFTRRWTLDSAMDIETLFSAEESPRNITVEPGDPGHILFTGGTTGPPKPVLQSQFAPIAGAYRYREAFQPEPGADRHFCVLQLYHIGGQQFGVLGPMISDIDSVLAKRFRASRHLPDVTKHGATISDILGGMLGALVQKYDEPVDNPLQSTVGAGSQDVYLEAVRLFNVEILEAYALTEGGGILLTHRTFDPETDVDVSGKPTGSLNDWANITIQDDDGVRLPPGEVGEICLRPTIPHTMMARYYGRPEATVETWENLWIHTGDLGWIDENDVLHYEGRESHLIRRMGELFSVDEVEEVLSEHPEVIEAAVVGLDNTEIGGDDVAAFIRGDITAGDLAEWVDGRLADVKLPTYIEVVSSFPRSETKNEIERYVLREWDLSGAWKRER